MSYSEREPRRSVELDVQMKDFSFIKTTDESALNLSPGGAFIRMDEPYPSGTLVKFKIVTKDNSIIDGVGKVAWLREKNGTDNAPSGVGIKFLKMSDQSRALLDKVLENADIIVPDFNSRPPVELVLDTKKPASVTPKPVISASKPPETAEVKSSQAPEKVESKASHPPQKIEVTASVPPPTTQTKPSVPPPKFELRPSAPPPKLPSVPPPQRASAPPPIMPVQASVPAPPPPIMGQPPQVVSPSAFTAESPVASSDESASDARLRTPSVQPEAPKPSTAAWVIGISVVLAVIVGAWLLLGKGSKPSTTDKEESVSVSAPDPAPSPSKEEVNPAPQDEPKTAAAVPGNEPAPTTPAAMGEPVAATPTAAATPAAAATPTSPTGPATAAPTPTAQTEPAVQPAAPAGETVAVDVTTTPPGATILINGQAQSGVTPLSINIEKDKESEVTAKLFEYVTESVKVTGAEGLKPIEISLKRSRLKFNFTSTPTGARIIIDGKFNGSTPYSFLRMRYKPEFQYKLEKKGYKDIEGVVTEKDWTEEGRYLVYTNDAALVAE
jgi:uncharacterized protein (TIGR02266 family)